MENPPVYMIPMIILQGEHEKEKAWTETSAGLGGMVSLLYLLTKNYIFLPAVDTYVKHTRLEGTHC